MKISEMKAIAQARTKTNAPSQWGSIMAVLPSPLGRANSWFAVGPFQDLDNEDWNVVAAKKDAKFIEMVNANIDKLLAVAECMEHAVEIGYFSEGGSTEGWAKEALAALESDE